MALQVGDAGEAEDLGVHEDDVRHDDEGRHAGHRVARERRPVRGEAEATLEERVPERVPQAQTLPSPYGLG